MTPHFRYDQGVLLCDGVPVADLAREYGTPLYVYSEAAIRESFRELGDAFAEAAPVICYAMKANDCLAICRVLKEEGSGFDIVSGGELFRALKVGADPACIVYAGVGKTRGEIKQALAAGIMMFNVESEPELDRIQEIAESEKAEARVALRLNPDVDARTHAHTTTGKRGAKFGLDLPDAEAIIRRMNGWPNVRLVGVHMHLGSPINTAEPYSRALERVVPLLETWRAAAPGIEWLNIGGGYGIEYRGGETVGPRDYAAAIVPHVKRSGCRLIMEPGRFLVGNAGILVSSVEYVKRSGGKTFVICDAGMNDLIRPALYGAYHRIWPVECAEPVPFGAAALEMVDSRVVVDVVGPVCESGDFLAKDRPLPVVRSGDLIAVFSAGAYAFSMGSNYNSRPRPGGVMIVNGSPRVVRERQSYEDMVAAERP